MGLLRILCGGLIAGALLGGGLAPCHADAQSKYVRQASGSDTVVVFVHGVLGHGQDTWASGTNFWPAMLASDETFNGANIFVYSYPTSMWATMSPDELAENMRLQLSARGVVDHRRIVFLAHSMGGLVTRAFLLKNRDVATRTSFAYFFSTPTAGSHVASLATLISRNPQFSKMKPMNADDYLADLLRQWLAAELKIPSYCAYEKRATYSLPIVTLQSASSLCTKALDPIDADHINIVKPADQNADAYLAFKAAYKREMGSRKPSLALVDQFERILNKLHQTQMRKAEDLFPQIEEYMRNPTERQWRIVRDTARTLADEIKVAAAESMSFDAQFYERGNEIIQAANGTMLTVDRPFNQAFRTARQEWNGKQFVLKEINRVENRPTPKQIKEWADDLKQRYDRLTTEIVRLLEVIRERT